MGEVRVPVAGAVAGPDPAGGGELPDLRPRPGAGPDPGAGLDQGGRGARSTRSSACSTRRPGRGDRRRPRTRSPRGGHDAPVPDRHVPDRVGHVVQHERQRGDRQPRRPRARASRCTPTTTSTRRSRPTTCSRPSIHLAATEAVSHDLIPALAHLCPHWTPRRAEFDGVVKAGRTHLMDATPVTLGQEFHGYGGAGAPGHRTAAVAPCPAWPSCRWAAPRSAPGINTPPRFAARVIERLRRRPGCR